MSWKDIVLERLLERNSVQCDPFTEIYDANSKNFVENVNLNALVVSVKTKLNSIQVIRL